MSKLSTIGMEEICIYFSILGLFQDFSYFDPYVSFLFFLDLLSPHYI